MTSFFLNLYRCSLVAAAVFSFSSMAYSYTITPVAGSSSVGFVDGNGAKAQFQNPNGVTQDGQGNLYIADMSNHSIRKIDAAGNVTTLAGNGQRGFTDSDSNEKGASFSDPVGVAVDSNGNVYVSDYDNHSIRKITPEGTVTTIAGDGSRGSEDGAAEKARFNYPWGITIDEDDNLYVADSLNHTIRKIANGQVTTIAGTPNVPGLVNGHVDEAQFAVPSALDIDQEGNLYVVENMSHSIRKIANGQVTTFVGNTASDNEASDTVLNKPIGIAINKQNGDVYVTDHKLLRKISAEGIVSTPPLSGLALSRPTNITIEKNGTLYVTEGYLIDRVLKITP